MNIQNNVTSPLLSPPFPSPSLPSLPTNNTLRSSVGQRSLTFILFTATFFEQARGRSGLFYERSSSQRYP